MAFRSSFVAAVFKRLTIISASSDLIPSNLTSCSLASYSFSSLVAIASAVFANDAFKEAISVNLAAFALPKNNIVSPLMAVLALVAIYLKELKPIETAITTVVNFSKPDKSGLFNASIADLTLFKPMAKEDIAPIADIIPCIGVTEVNASIIFLALIPASSICRLI